MVSEFSLIFIIFIIVVNKYFSYEVVGEANIAGIILTYQG